MFQNSYQGNSYFELFDAKSTSVGYSDIKERERPIFKLANSSNASKQFDKQLKGKAVADCRLYARHARCHQQTGVSSRGEARLVLDTAIPKPAIVHSARRRIRSGDNNHRQHQSNWLVNADQKENHFLSCSCQILTKTLFREGKW